MSAARRSAMALKTVSVRPVAMTDMGLGCNGCELNGDQQDRCPKNSQKRAGRSHEWILPYGPSQRNNGSKCGKCVVTPLSTIRSADDGHQLCDLLSLIGFVTAGDRVFDAMRNVVLQHFFLDAPQRGPHGRDLCDDIDAIAILVHHLGQAAHLALDTAQTLLTGCLDVFSHNTYIPLLGMGYKWCHGERDEQGRNPNFDKSSKGLRLFLPKGDGRAGQGGAEIGLLRRKLGQGDDRPSHRRA